MFEPTSVTHHFVLSLRKADLSTAHWSSSVFVVTEPGRGSEPDYKTTWRISWLPDRPALELVEDMAGNVRPQGCSTRLRSSTTVATMLVYDGATDHQTASPSTSDRASWEPHASLLGWSTEVKRAQFPHFGCVAGAWTWVVQETSGDTYETYEMLLEWLRFGQIQFGDYHAPDLVLTRDQEIAREEDHSPTDMLATVEHLSPALPLVHLEKFSPSSAPNPEAIYRLADSLGIKALRHAAFEAFSSSLIPTSALSNLFSPFSHDLRPVADLCIEFCAAQRKEPDLTRIRNLIDRDELAIGAVEGAEPLPRLYVKIAQLEWQDKRGGHTVCLRLPRGWMSYEQSLLDR